FQLFIRDPVTNLNIAHQRNVNNNNSTEYLWRLKLFPNVGDKKSTEFVSLYLEAIQTHYERQNGITEVNFEFNGVNADYGFARLKIYIPMKSYLPNLPEMDLSVRAEIFDDLTTTTTTTMTHGEDSTHRVILAARSEYFERLLSGEWLEDSLNLDLLKDVYSKADMLNINELTFM
ncbi:6149_t:CDS:2, partial [Diversispora eburnea]